VCCQRVSAADTVEASFLIAQGGQLCKHARIARGSTPAHKSASFCKWDEVSNAYASCHVLPRCDQGRIRPRSRRKAKEY
jgi:hypothetical protein